MKEFIHVNKIHNFSNTFKVSDALKGVVFADKHNNLLRKKKFIL